MVACIAAARFRRKQVRSFRFLDRVKGCIRLPVFERLQEVHAEASTDDRSRRQYAPGIFTKPVQPAAQYQTNPMGYLELVGGKIGKPLAIFVKQFAFLREMTKKLLDKEGIPLGLSEERSNHRGRRRVPAYCREHAVNAALG